MRPAVVVTSGAQPASSLASGTTNLEGVWIDQTWPLLLTTVGEPTESPAGAVAIADPGAAAEPLSLDMATSPRPPPLG